MPSYHALLTSRNFPEISMEELKALLDSTEAMKYLFCGKQVKNAKNNRVFTAYQHNLRIKQDKFIQSGRN